MEDFDYKKAVHDIQAAINRLVPPPAKEVLIVDDQQNDVFVLCRLLEGYCVNVTKCHSGEEATQKIRSRKFDIVFLDVIMPAISGYEVMQKTVGLNPGTHFVIVTGYPSSERVDAMLKMGAVAVPKPITAEVLDLFLQRKP